MSGTAQPGDYILITADIGEEYIVGDVNMNGILDEDDVAIVRQAVLQGTAESDFTLFQQRLADVNQDDKISAKDYTLIEYAIKGTSSTEDWPWLSTGEIKFRKGDVLLIGETGGLVPTYSVVMNATGPIGPIGPTGATGGQGPQGEQGIPGAYRDKLIGSYTITQTDTYIESIDFAVGSDTSEYVIATIPAKGSVAAGNALSAITTNPQDLLSSVAISGSTSFTVAEVTTIVNDSGQNRLRIRFNNKVWTRTDEAKLSRFYLSKNYTQHITVKSFPANTYKELRVRVKGRLTGMNRGSSSIRMGPNGWGTTRNSEPAGLRFIGSEPDSYSPENYTNNHFCVSPAGYGSFVMDGVFSNVNGYSLTGTITTVSNTSAASITTRILGLQDICPPGFVYEEYINSFAVSTYFASGFFTSGTVFEFYEV